MRRRSRRIALLLTAAVAVPVLAVTGCSGDSGQASSGDSGQASSGDPAGSGASPSASQGPSGSSGSSAEEAEMEKKIQDAEKAANDADADAAEDSQ
ncbi:hypothetical protein ACFVZM_25660 [Streptomyces sioyaensis]|uniref:hypothetical protein n=1 Tax=Streptomyces sioyaensis TaxID=67364 RepID=UPI0036765C9F